MTAAPEISRLRRIVATGIAATAAVLGLAVAPPAAAAPATTPPAPFTYCPVGWTSPTGKPLATCLASIGTGGTFRLGKTTVTLSPGTTLQGGLGVGDDGITFVPATEGMTLSAPAQSVPGGVLGIAHLENLIPGVTDIQALVQLAGTPNFSLGQDIHITLPITVRLKNALLGPKCTIGTAANPIVLHLTTGTTTPPDGVDPVTGTPGTISSTDGVLKFAGQTVVDNTFAVPAASNCGALGLLNKVVDAKSGLPAAPGKSLAKLVSDTSLVAASQVSG